MSAASQAELLAACRLLFGRRLEPAFLGHLQESGLRSAWRRTALLTHPDRVPDRAVRRRQTDRFIQAREAYGLLREFLGQRDRQRPRPAPPPRTQHGPRPRHAGRGAPPPAAVRLPGRRLLLGEFLYHSRVISFGLLVEALVWQRRQRDRFCEIGRRWGYLTEVEARRLLAVRLPHEPVGAAAARLRLLTPFQVRTVLAHQRSRQRPLGGYFVARGLVSPADLALLLRHLQRHNDAVAARRARR